MEEDKSVQEDNVYPSLYESLRNMTRHERPIVLVVHVMARKTRADDRIKGRAGWENEPASVRQLAYLRDRGIGLKDGITKGEASQLLDAVNGKGSFPPFPLFDNLAD